MVYCIPTTDFILTTILVTFPESTLHPVNEKDQKVEV
jgi:hypothetical protein